MSNDREKTPVAGVAEATAYRELAAALIAALDQFRAAVPDFGTAHHVSKEFIDRKKRIPAKFVVDAVSALLVNDDLQSIPLLKRDEVLDDQQYVENLAPVLRHLGATWKGLKFNIDAREARLAAASQQIYGVARSLASDRDAAAITAHVENMKRSRYPRRRRKADGEGEEAAKQEGTGTGNPSK